MTAHQAAINEPAHRGRTSATVDGFKRALMDNLYYIRGQGAQTAGPNDIYVALAYTVRDHLMDGWRRTADLYAQARPKFVYYLSAEYLLGRQLAQNMLYTGTTELARQALAELGYDLDALIELEPEPGLGNGGLGRLAACFLDSMATLGIPCVGYGIRYEFGIFKQSFRDGWQAESPDEWLYHGNPWEFEQPDRLVQVGFGGATERYTDAQGRDRVRWTPGETVLGEPYHTLVPGFRSGTVNMLRLWRARASQEFNFQLFDGGDYIRAVAEKIRSENITKVLYPNDNTPEGRELRLRQQYFFVACSIHDIIRRFLAFHAEWASFPETAVIQLNDTHPVIAIAELMRVLTDDHGLEWDAAWAITTRSFGYTLHTLLPEALEKWPVSLFERLLPRHLEIIYAINQRLLDEVGARFPGDGDRIVRMSLIEEGYERTVRMAHLGATGSFALNGVSALQSGLLRERTLRDFYELWPEKFTNVTNGVTPRRFVRLANPRLAGLITPLIGDGWLTDLEELRRLEPYADDAGFRRQWMAVKQANKTALAAALGRWTGISVAPDSLFDMMVKRLHEFKRNLLKTLHIITLYHRLIADPGLELLTRTFIFAAKAAPGYHMAKLIIKLTNSVAEVVNRDPVVAGRLRVVFVPNFNVTVGEWLYPAADISEQISLAGKEASGTGNMKFALNGALTAGTLDGANIEIREWVGAENFFLFGLTAPEVFALKAAGYRPRDYYEQNEELRATLDSIAGGEFSDGDATLFRPIVESLLDHDEYMLLADYASYLQSQDAIEAAYRDPARWARMSILNAARCGFFSSDRAIRQYAQTIWRVAPVG